MAKYMQLTRQEFQDYRKIKSVHSALHGQYILYGKRDSKDKFVGKHLSQDFITTRQQPIPCYRGDNQPLYFFELEGESLEGIFQYKTETVNSKATASQLVCWMTRYHDFQRNLQELFHLGLRLESQGITEILLGCFRVVKQKLVYHYDGWLKPSAAIVRDNIQQLERYYFSQSNLYEIKQGLPLTNTKKVVLFRVALLVLHLGTRQLGLRLYEFGEYSLNSSNLTKRLEVFRVKYPRLHHKVSQVLNGEVDRLDDMQRAESFSTIQLVDANHKILEGSSITDDSFFSRTANLSEGSYSGKKLITLFSGQKKTPTAKKQEREQTKSREKQNKVTLSESNFFSKKKLILHNSRKSCQPHNSLTGFKELMVNANLQDVDESTSLYSLLQIGEEDLHTTYQVKLVTLLRNTYVQPGWAKRTYTNHSVYIGDLKEDQRQGKGFYLFESGDAYSGGWKGNKMHGFGKYLYRNGQLYEGELWQGMKHGHGRNEYSSGRNYEGNWVDNKKEGLGAIRYPDGQSFIGIFYGGKREAEGVYVGANGEVHQGILEPESLNETCLGRKEQLESPTSVQPSHKHKQSVEIDTGEGAYRGETVNGVPEGYGVLVGQSGTYEGYWKNGLKHGKGRLKSTDYVIQARWQADFIVQYYG